MTDAEPKKALKTEEEEQVLPLVIEIMPGQAGEGLVDIYQPGSYATNSGRYKQATRRRKIPFERTRN